LPHIAHDSSQKLVSAKKLPEPLDIQIPFVEEGATAPLPGHKTYNVHFSFVQELKISEINSYLSGDTKFVKYNPNPILSAAQLVISQHSVRTALRVGASRYFNPSTDQRFQLSQAIYAFQGFYASVRPSYNQLAVNINACMSAFIFPGRLDEMLFAFSRNAQGALPNMPPKLAKATRVTTRYLGYKKKSRIKRIGTTSARDTRFPCTDFGGKNTTVEEFFLKKYNIKLKHPADLPVVDIAGPQKSTPVWVPAELCDVELQAYGEKLSPEETAQMIRVACRPPAANATDTVERGLPQLAFTQGTMASASSPLAGFGIEVRPEHATVPARILPAPNLSYSKGRASVKGGAWNIVDVQFHRGGIIKNWWTLYVRDGPPGQRQLIDGADDPRLKTLAQGFINKCRTSGMRIESPVPNRLFTPALPGPNMDAGRIKAVDIIRQLILTNVAKYGKPTFILVLLSREDDYIYPGIKKIGDVELGIHTLHMLLKDGRNALGEPNKADQYFSNIALKLNTKLEGINHRLDENSMRWLTKRPTMMVGIDVTHPSPRSRPGTPSIAAVVASVDRDFVHFPCSLRLQKKSKKEMVDDLEPMMIERLQAYQSKNKKTLPEKIIIFRDGVSEVCCAVIMEYPVSDRFTRGSSMWSSMRSSPSLYRPVRRSEAQGKFIDPSCPSSSAANGITPGSQPVDNSRLTRVETRCLAPLSTRESPISLSTTFICRLMQGCKEQYDPLITQ
jgi:eukaryotic translation initiation factor 2C